MCDLAATGGGRLVAVAIVAGDGAPAGALRALPAAAVRARRAGPAGGRRGGARADALGDLLPAAFGPGRRGGAAPADERPRPSTSSAPSATAEELSGRGDPLVPRRLHPRRGGRRAGLGAADGGLLPRPLPARARHLDRRDDPLRRAARPLGGAPPARWTSTPPAAWATRSRCRCARWWRPAARRCPSSRAAGLGHTGGTLDKLEAIPGFRVGPHGDAVRAAARRGRGGHLRGGRRPGPRRPQALRAARRDGHGRVDPAHRQLDHVQEDRRGHRRPWCWT